jgi:hypothetical protein
VLYRPEAFEPLTDEPWDEERVRRAIRAIVADADGAYDPDRLWPVAGDWDSVYSRTSLGWGAAGVILALDLLRRRGHAEVRLDLSVGARRILDAWREEPDKPERLEPPISTHASLYSGETGILLVAFRLAPNPGLADDLHARVSDNWDNETNELMEGSPGTMLAANAMRDWTGEDRWADAWRMSADELWRRRYLDGFWSTPPYG